LRRTTIFLPDELHERLRRDALRANVSMAELIRIRLQRSAASSDPILKVAGVCRGPALSNDVDDSVYT